MALITPPHRVSSEVPPASQNRSRLPSRPRARLWTAGSLSPRRSAAFFISLVTGTRFCCADAQQLATVNGPAHLHPLGLGQKIALHIMHKPDSCGGVAPAACLIDLGGERLRGALVVFGETIDLLDQVRTNRRPGQHDAPAR